MTLLLVGSQLPFAGFLADDFLHRAIVDGHIRWGSSKWDLYRFFSGDPSDLVAGLERGLVPWFVYPEIKLAFFRPLASALTVFDITCFGDWAPGYLLHTGVWYVALCVLAARLYERLFSRRAARIASVLFIVAAIHHQAVLWFSARSGIVAATFGLLGLLSHLSYRESGHRSRLLLSLLAFVLALLAGEAGLGTVLLLVAYECLGAPGSRRERLLAMVPALCLTAFYVGVYVALGYGTHGSAAYINPLDEPLRYARELPVRLFASLGVLTLALPADLWFFLPKARVYLAGLGALGVLLFGFWYVLTLRKSARSEQKAPHWLILGALLALLPQMAGLLGPRSYLISSIAVYGVFGFLLDCFLGSRARGAARAVGLAGVVIVLVGHGLVGPLAWLGGGRFYTDVARATAARTASLELPDVGLESDDVVLVSTPDVFIGVYLPLEWAARGASLPRTFRLLSLSECDHRVTRPLAHVLDVELLGCALLETPFEELYRHPAHSLKLGEVVEVPGFRAEVRGLGESGQANRLRFEFARSLDDPAMRVYSWHDGAMRRLTLPVGGSSVERWVRPF